MRWAFVGCAMAVLGMLGGCLVIVTGIDNPLSVVTGGALVVINVALLLVNAALLAIWPTITR